MVKFFVKPSRSASARSMRTHMEWKVDTHMPRERVPTSCARRSRISAAALLVKVMAENLPGRAARCLLEDVGDAVGEHARLAGAGAGQHQKRAFRGDDRLALGAVQGVDVDGHGRSCFFHFFDRQQSGWRQCANRAVLRSLNGSP